MEDDRRVEVRAQGGLLAGASAGLALLLRVCPPERYSIYPICLWRAVTGWRCPGCGTTRALAALLAGHWRDAIHYNAPAVAIAPLAALILAIECYSALRYNRWRHAAAAGTRIILKIASFT